MDNIETDRGTLFFCEAEVPEACKMASGILGCCKGKDQNPPIF